MHSVPQNSAFPLRAIRGLRAVLWAPLSGALAVSGCSHRTENPADSMKATTAAFNAEGAAVERPGHPEPGCGGGSDHASCGAASEHATSCAASEVVPDGRVFGAPITSTIVPLEDVAQHPGKYAGKEFATAGKVTAVCQERGCWLEISDASGRAHVRMHGHSFFVPRTAPGHTAKIEATLVPSSGPEGDPHPGAGLARVELDARGVELD